MRSLSWTINAIIRAHEAKGGHFFDRATMKGFNSRVLGDVAEGPGGVYFVTSETCGRGAPRRYSVRRFEPADGSIRTAEGGWQVSDTPVGAWRLAREICAMEHIVPAPGVWCTVCGYEAAHCTGMTARETPSLEEAPQP